MKISNRIIELIVRIVNFYCNIYAIFTISAYILCDLERMRDAILFFYCSYAYEDFLLRIEFGNNAGTIEHNKA